MFFEVAREVAAEGFLRVEVAGDHGVLGLLVENVIQVARLPFVAGVVALDCIKKGVIHSVLLRTILLVLKLGGKFNGLANQVFFVDVFHK